MASINRTLTLNDIPDTKGKAILVGILNSPKADRVKLHHIAETYEKKRVAEWNAKKTKKK